jgi:hypothetical protein
LAFASSADIVRIGGAAAFPEIGGNGCVPGFTFGCEALLIGGQFTGRTSQSEVKI